jgi:hypothetical protein
MDDWALERECAELIGLIEGQHEGKPGKRWRCPAGLKQRVVAYAEVCRGQGESTSAIAQRLGLVEATLCRWLRRDWSAIVPALRPVAIIEGGGDTAQLSGLRLVSPRGFIVEGLDVQEAAYLLRVLS